jgi:hypothetical protein
MGGEGAGVDRLAQSALRPVAMVDSERGYHATPKRSCKSPRLIDVVDVELCFSGPLAFPASLAGK